MYCRIKGWEWEKKLEKIFKIFHGPKVTSEIKEMIVINLPDIPLEIRKILHEMNDKINQDFTVDDLYDVLSEK